MASKVNFGFVACLPHQHFSFFVLQGNFWQLCNVGNARIL